jgi:assimilatory nitrate reductase catalytic subunit
MTTTRTTCPYCGVGCGVLATRKPDDGLEIKGDPDHPANFGKLCSKGLALGETFGDEQRLLYPQVDGLRAPWKTAVATVAEKFKAAIAEHGPDSVAFYVSGQLLTEDYYVANKLMKGFIGSGNIDTNSRLCMASAVAGHKRAFGADIVPCNYSDLEEADLVILTGSNFAWCHPVLFQRLIAAREKRGTKIVVIDPRRTVTAEAADLHLAITPQSDVALFNGLFRFLQNGGHHDENFIHQHTEQFSDTLIAVKDWVPEKVVEACGVSFADLEKFFQLFAQNKKVITAFSMGVNQSAWGTDKVNAIINCHLLTGRIGKAGAGPFSITGQPNAMGGREVGGLANMLAAHMEIENPQHRNAVQKFWNAPKITQKAGLKAVDLFQAVHNGSIKALWIMATNPAVSMPNSNFIAEALRKCPFVVLSDVTAKTDTAHFADVLLPARGWGEKDGTVTNSERMISRQRRFIEPPGEARADWQIIADVAKAMGFAGFDYQSPAEIFYEHAKLTTVENSNTRELDLTRFIQQDYETMPPQQWGNAQPFADHKFQTPSGKANFVPTQFQQTPSAGFTLNTGRIRDQWHTMTRTGLVPKLFSHRAEPHIEIASQDAVQLGIAAASLVEVHSANGRSLARALTSETVQPGQIFQPMHWSGAFAHNALSNATMSDLRDPVSGQPALKSANVSLRPFQVAWYGFGVSYNAPFSKTEYFALRPLNDGLVFECADKATPKNWSYFLSENFPTLEITCSVQGANHSQYRCVALKNGQLAFAFYASDKPVAVSREWLQQLLGKPVDPIEILAGRPLQASDDKGAILCACMNVGRNQISRFIEKNCNTSLQATCEATSAGTGCGSCRLEVQRMIEDNKRVIQAALKPSNAPSRTSLG